MGYSVIDEALVAEGIDRVARTAPAAAGESYAFPGTSPRKPGALGAAWSYIDGGEVKSDGRESVDGTAASINLFTILAR